LRFRLLFAPDERMVSRLVGLCRRFVHALFHPQGGRAMTKERRKNRSDLPHEAAAMYLETVASTHGMGALTVANEDGLLVAGTGGSYHLPWLAALGSVCASRTMRYPALDTLVHDVTGGKNLYATAFSVRGEMFYLTSIGVPVPQAGEAAAALGRILARVLPA
jgi:hypothetical protein